MARGLTASMATECQAATVRPVLFVELDFNSGFERHWTGRGDVVVFSNTYSGDGDLLGMRPIRETINVEAVGAVFELSGVPSALITKARDDFYQGRSAKAWLGFIDSAGAVIADPEMVYEGRLDVVEFDESGRESMITVLTESRLRDLGRPRVSRYTHEEQQIAYSGDLGFEYVSDLQDKVIVWGFQARSIFDSRGARAGTKYSPPGSLTLREPAGSRKMVYGEARAPGTIVFAHIDTGHLYLVIALVGHEVEAINEVLFDEEAIPLEADGTVSSGHEFENYATVKKHLGTAAQTADSMLTTAIGTKWTSNHRLRGVAYLAIDLDFDPDIFHNGVPNISAVVQGKKVLDTRTSSTVWTDNAALCIRDFYADADFGFEAGATEFDTTALDTSADDCDDEIDLGASTPTFDFTADAATEIYTQTVAASAVPKVLQRNDVVVLTTTGTLPAGLALATRYNVIRLSSTTFSLATSLINARAGTAINITDAGTGTHTVTRESEPRFTINGVVDSAISPAQILADLHSAMAGRTVHNGGLFTIRTGKYAAPTITLDEGDLRDPIKTRFRVSRRTLFNQVVGTYISPGNKWQPSDLPEVTNSTFVTQDASETIPQSFDFPFTNSAAMGQRLAKIALERNRQQVSAAVPCNLTALRLLGGESVAITNTRLGWSAKAFDIHEWLLSMERDDNDVPIFGIDLLLSEITSGVYTWAATEETIVTAAPEVDLLSVAVLFPSAITADKIANDAVTEANILDGAVTSDKLAAGAASGSLAPRDVQPAHFEFYEFESWVPTLGGSTSDGTPAYTTQKGWYHRMMDQVVLGFTIELSAKTGISGNVSVKGLPLTAGVIEGDGWAGRVTEVDSINLDVAGGFYQHALTLASAGSDIKLLQMGDNVAAKAITDTDLAAASKLVGTITYQLNSGLATNFDETNDYGVLGKGLPGVVDSKKFTMAVRLKLAAAGSNWFITGQTAAGGTAVDFRVLGDVTGKINCFNAAGTNRVVRLETVSELPDTSWHWWLVSVDLAAASNSVLSYLNDSSDILIVDELDENINFALANWIIGAQKANGTGGKFAGCIAFLWFFPGVYLDFTVTANRRLFHDAAGVKANVGVNGETPTGASPPIYLPRGNPEVNMGTAGKFVQQGTYAECASNP